MIRYLLAAAATSFYSLAIAQSLIPSTPLPPAPQPTTGQLSFDQALAMALRQPRAAIASADRDIAAARSEEARAANYPRLTVTGFVAPSPEARCENAECTMTSPRSIGVTFDGIFAGVSATLTQPVYTFDKIANAQRAAAYGEQVAAALGDEAAGDIAVDVARAYWGGKLARTLGYMLDDGIEQITAATKTMATDPTAAIADKQRILVLLSEAQSQRADASRAQGHALAALRALTGDSNADVDDNDLVWHESASDDLALQRSLVRSMAGPAARPTLVRSMMGSPSGAANDGSHRPQLRAAIAGAKAADALVDFERSQRWPDVAVVATASASRARGVDDPPSVFANDPFNQTSAGLALLVRWQVEPWTATAKIEQANAKRQKAKHTAAAAADAARYDVQVVTAAQVAGRTKLQATAQGEAAAKAWLASVLQGQAVGTAEAKELVDAYIAWFQMRARWAATVTEQHILDVQYRRAVGEFVLANSVKHYNRN